VFKPGLVYTGDQEEIGPNYVLADTLFRFIERMLPFWITVNILRLAWTSWSIPIKICVKIKYCKYVTEAQGA